MKFFIVLCTLVTTSAFQLRNNYYQSTTQTLYADGRRQFLGTVSVAASLLVPSLASAGLDNVPLLAGKGWRSKAPFDELTSSDLLLAGLDNVPGKAWQGKKYKGQQFIPGKGWRSKASFDELTSSDLLLAGLDNVPGKAWQGKKYKGQQFIPGKGWR